MASSSRQVQQGPAGGSGNSFPTDNELFDADPEQMTGDILVHLARRYGVGEIAKQVNARHPSNEVSAPLLSNRLQRAVEKIAAARGTTKDVVRKEIQDDAKRNGVQVNGKRTAPLAVAMNGQEVTEAPNGTEEEDESESGDEEEEVHEDNGVPSRFLGLWGERAARVEREKSSRKKAAPSTTKPLDPRPVHDGTFRSFN
ncbi:Hypothetical predicted protein [Lecanosticta acicola]|uniref:Uncharacterized protein n=1 Tax=Lecanosticta acicola TaxID=111012 RepID=A0AAI9EFH4_9PEZI|nr:Hypothetical predicted protein [Lecanosticta acicola]